MATKKRTIAVVTGSRAEFGLLEPVMRAIEDHARLTLRVVAAGLHLSRKTWRDITGAGFDIHAEVRMQSARPGSTGRDADVQALGKGVGGFGKALADLRPDVTIVLGDRIEALAAAIAASVGGYRLAHIHGGDRAEGVADEAMRHAISKLAHLHFAATPRSRSRLIRMGEPNGLVYDLGSPAADGLKNVQAASGGPRIIVAQHPIGATDAQEQRWMTWTLEAVGTGDDVLVIGPNDDPGAPGIRAAIDKAGPRNVDHMPRETFVAMLAGAKVIVGNSSTGLIEAAILKTACVNVGPRQAGRETCGNAIACDYGKANVNAALDKALRLDLRRLRHPYGGGRTGRRIADLLATIDLNKVPLRKRNTY